MISVKNYVYKNRVTTALNVETDIIASITASPIGRTVILVIMYVETFKTDGALLFYKD